MLISRAPETTVSCHFSVAPDTLQKNTCILLTAIEKDISSLNFTEICHGENTQTLLCVIIVFYVSRDRLYLIRYSAEVKKYVSCTLENLTKITHIQNCKKLRDHLVSAQRRFPETFKMNSLYLKDERLFFVITSQNVEWNFPLKQTKTQS